jgi:hypothetical protein
MARIETSGGPAEIADELITMLAAGHETTATSLAWAVERFAETPHAA